MCDVCKMNTQTYQPDKPVIDRKRTNQAPLTVELLGLFGRGDGVVAVHHRRAGLLCDGRCWTWVVVDVSGRFCGCIFIDVSSLTDTHTYIHTIPPADRYTKDIK